MNAPTTDKAASGPDWSALVERMARRDASAMSELYEQSSPMVYGLALRIMQSRDLAEDVAVEVFAQAWRDATSYDSARGTVCSWLLTLTRSRAIDLLRARRREDATDPIEAAAVIECNRPGPEAVTAAAECGHFVRKAIALLAPDQREAIELAFFGGFSHSEIAERLGQPLGTVKTRIRMGMLKLRSQLAHLGTPALASGEV